MARLDSAWPGKAWQAGIGLARLGVAWHGLAGEADTAWLVLVWRGMASQGKSRQANHNGATTNREQPMLHDLSEMTEEFERMINNSDDNTGDNGQPDANRIDDTDVIDTRLPPDKPQPDTPPDTRTPTEIIAEQREEIDLLREALDYYEERCILLRDRDRRRRLAIREARRVLRNA